MLASACKSVLLPLQGKNTATGSGRFLSEITRHCNSNGNSKTTLLLPFGVCASSIRAREFIQQQLHHNHQKQQQRRSFSSTSPAVNFELLKRIKRDLVEVDVNSDGRIDFEELKLLLQKYSTTDGIPLFSEQQVEDIGELFYVGRAGRSVSHTTFLRGIQHVITAAAVANAKDVPQAATDTSNSTAEKDKNPLQLQSIDNKSCWINPHESASIQFQNIQSQFESSLLEYVDQINLLQQLGGDAVLEQATTLLYEKAWDDDRIRPFFLHAMAAKGSQKKSQKKKKDKQKTTEEEAFVKSLKKHQYNFMKVAFGKKIPNQVKFHKKMKKVHANLFQEAGLNETHFDIMMGHFVDVLQELKLNEDSIDTAVEILHLFRDAFVQDKATDKQPSENEMVE